MQPNGVAGHWHGFATLRPVRPAAPSRGVETETMRYPLWAFLFLFLLPPFAAHALLTGNARLDDVPIHHTRLIAPLLR